MKEQGRHSVQVCEFIYVGDTFFQLELKLYRSMRICTEIAGHKCGSSAFFPRLSRGIGLTRSGSQAQALGSPWLKAGVIRFCQFVPPEDLCGSWREGRSQFSQGPCCL